MHDWEKGVEVRITNMQGDINRNMRTVAVGEASSASKWKELREQIATKERRMDDIEVLMRENAQNSSQSEAMLHEWEAAEDERMLATDAAINKITDDSSKHSAIELEWERAEDERMKRMEALVSEDEQSIKIAKEIALKKAEEELLSRQEEASKWKELQIWKEEEEVEEARKKAADAKVRSLNLACGGGSIMGLHTGVQCKC